jgi:hypothetical protein
MMHRSKSTLTAGTGVCVLVVFLFAIATIRARSAPCGTPFGAPGISGSTLTLAEGGSIVYDKGQGLCWLADANLAGNPAARGLIKLSSMNPDHSLPAINPDGTMDYPTAVNWVHALNAYNNGKGWLNHNNWQLPSTPSSDPSCSVKGFGALCQGSAMGYLYNAALAKNFPDSVVPRFFTIVWPLFNLQPGLYWADDKNAPQNTFSFNTGLPGENTTKYNFFHVLPMTTTLLGSFAEGEGVVPYVSGPGAGRAVYDKLTGLSWTLDANLPAARNFNFTDTVTLDLNGTLVPLPAVNAGGTVHFAAIDPTNPTYGWIAAMNTANYAGSNSWKLPAAADLGTLFTDLGLHTGDPRLEWPFFVGPFWRLQPGFYWSCVRENDALTNSPCDYTKEAPSMPGVQATPEWSFNFDDGFQGTDHKGRQFYVMVYFPAS